MLPKSHRFCRLMESVKEKISISSSQEKIKLLTLVPPSWTIKDSSSYFGVTKSMIKKAKKLESEKGLFAEPNKKLGKKISEDMVKCILVFLAFLNTTDIIKLVFEILPAMPKMVCNSR